MKQMKSLTPERWSIVGWGRLLLKSKWFPTKPGTLVRLNPRLLT